MVPGWSGAVIGGRRRAVGRLVSSELLAELDALLVLALDALLELPEPLLAEVVPVGAVLLEACALEFASLAPVP
jgi:hypothetical protein